MSKGTLRQPSTKPLLAPFRACLCCGSYPAATIAIAIMVPTAATNPTPCLHLSQLYPTNAWFHSRHTRVEDSSRCMDASRASNLANGAHWACGDDCSAINDR